jgi:hypothetical protein
MRASALLDVGPRMVVAERHGPFSTSEIALHLRIVGDIPDAALTLMDSYCLCWRMLWDIHAGGRRDFLLRVQERFRPRTVRVLGPGDELVRMPIDKSARRGRPDLPKWWTLRMVTYRPPGADADVRLLTSVLDEKAAGAEFAALYRVRWEEETAFDELKTHLCGLAGVARPLTYRSRTPDRIEQEYYGLLIAYNAVRAVMAEAAEAAGADADRLSFVFALERIGEAVREMMLLPTPRLAERYAELLAAVAACRVPRRPGRHFPRAVRICRSKYPHKKRRPAA